MSKLRKDGFRANDSPSRGYACSLPCAALQGSLVGGPGAILWLSLMQGKYVITAGVLKALNCLREKYSLCICETEERGAVGY